MEDRIFKKGFGLKAQVAGALIEDYHSHIVEYLKTHNFTFTVQDITFRLAREFGFCYGVDRAVDYAYETRQHFPGRRIFITSEIIHNPRVNQRLQELGIEFLTGPYACGKTYDDIRPDDVVLIPAFGNTMEELERLTQQGCILVDTTCGSVMAVWRRVEQYAREGFTAIIHGKYYHEETKATASRATQYPQGRYLIVLDKTEAQQVCTYIVQGGDRQRCLERFARQASPGFDPALDLKKVGLANQTTMLANESLEIAQVFKEAMTQRYGQEALPEHFHHFDTICSATQDRQDAILALVKEPLDLLIVIGGYNSSNTNHLCAIASRYVKTYHIDEVSRIRSEDEIEHKPVDEKDPIITRDWLPPGPLAIGLTAGASTPNRVIGEAIERILTCRGYTLSEGTLPSQML